MPTWIYYMAASCFTAFMVGYIAAYVIDEWKNR